MLRKSIAALAAIVMTATTSLASAYGTREEAVDMVQRAIAFYEANGIEALVDAVHDTSNGDFHDRDLYVFIVSLENGQFVAHGVNQSLVGRDLRGISDASGKAFGFEMHSVAQEQSSGWVDYVWDSPTSDDLLFKESYVESFGAGYFAGVGVYREVN